MTGGSVMDWWGEGRGARPLVVRDMSSGARDRTCVEGALLNALPAVGPRAFSSKKRHTESQLPGQRAEHTHEGAAPGFHTTLETYRPGR
jgi:hypothetical protein